MKVACRAETAQVRRFARPVDGALALDARRAMRMAGWREARKGRARRSATGGKSPKRNPSKRLAHVDWRNLQRLAVLRDRAPGDQDSLLAEHVGDLAVGKRYFRVFGGDQLLDQRANRR